MSFETTDHTADIGLRIRADDLDSLFVDAARGLVALIVGNPESIRPENEYSFALEGNDLPFLLFDWLNELLYTFDTKRVLLSRFDVSIRDGQLQAVARGEPCDPERHHLEHEVKAITYHGLEVRQSNDRWEATVIVDI